MSRRTRAALVLPAAALATVSLAACGGGGSAAASTTSAASVSGTAAAVRNAGAAGFQAYAACLTRRGISVPTGRPGLPGGAGRPSGAPRSRGAGGFFGLDTADPKTAAAVKACAALRPTGRFGGANASALASQLTAYRSCLSDHGVALPTRSAPPTDAPAAGASGAAARRGAGGFGIGALNTADPKVAAAVKACAALRPTFAPGRAAATPTPTPNA